MLSPALEFRSGISEQASSMGANWYTISGVVNVKDSAAHLLETIATLRRAGAVHIHVTPLTYSFFDESISVRTLRERLKRKA